MHWDLVDAYLTSKLRKLHIYICSYFQVCDIHAYTHIYRFVDADGNSYNPVKPVTGPHGSTYMFTGPKVHEHLPLCATKFIHKHLME